MKIYQVDQIRFSIKWSLGSPYIDKSNKYEINDLDDVSHHFKTHIVNEIILPKGKIYGSKNPYRIKNDQTTSIYSIDKLNEVKLLMSYDDNYHHINLYLNKQKIKNIYETEYIFLGIMFLEMMMNYGYLPLHASAIEINNDAFLISAPSKTGKSTQTRYFKEVYPNACVINEDKPLLKIENKQVYVIGSMFSGAHVENENKKSIVKGIYFLNQANDNQILPLSKEDFFLNLMKNTLRPKEIRASEMFLHNVDVISKSLSGYRFEAINNKIASTHLLNHFRKEVLHDEN